MARSPIGPGSSPRSTPSKSKPQPQSKSKSTPPANPKPNGPNGHTGAGYKSIVNTAAGTTSWKSWALLLPLFTLWPYFLCRLHYHLPSPLPPLDAEGRPQPSEEIVLSHIRALDEIGYRTVGTPQALQGEEYVASQVTLLKSRCDANGVLKCEMWVQQGSGFHEFNIVGHDVLKLYSGIRNVVLKVSALDPPSGPVEPGSKDSILLGAHIDSTLPSPGAADDGMGVGVMLDLARVLIDRNEPFDNSVIFMWNGGEETLQDGSHLYSTQHETASTVKAVINLEAAGSTGGALLFQATSKEMIEAYSHAPYPRGTVVAADVFSSGIIMSDTDFGQFEEYLNVSGLDMAIVGHSYYYHTRKDTLANIQPGSAQHFTSNMFPVLQHLLSSSSPLSIPESEWSPPDVIYLSLYDRIFYSFPLDLVAPYYLALAVMAAVMSMLQFARNLRPLVLALVGTPVGLIAGMLAANGLAGVLCLVDKRMTWFSHEFLCLYLYVPIAYIAQLGSQHLLSRLVSPVERTSLEPAYLHAQMLYFSWYMLILQSFRIRSAYLYALLTSIMFIGVAASGISKLLRGSEKSGRGSVEALVFAPAYMLPTAASVFIAVETLTTTLDIFVPLTGRMGKTAPSEFIIATISAACGITFFPTSAPLFHRLSRRAQRRVLATLVLLAAGVLVVFTGPWWSPYDAEHPKRMIVQYTYNHTSEDHTAHIGFLDWPLNQPLAESVHERYGIPGTQLEHTKLTPNESDFDVLYPLPSFLDTYRFPLDGTGEDVKDFKWPKMTPHFERTVMPEHDAVHYKFHLDFAGLVWPVIAFEAEILDWTFDHPPPHGLKRHHIKTATSVDEHYLDLELTLRLHPEDKVSIHWSAIDVNQMVPGTAYAMGPNMPASKWLIDMDQWAVDKYKGSLDILMSGIVVGILDA